MSTGTVFHIPPPSIFSKQNTARAWRTAESDLPEWMQRAPKEIVLFEIERAYFQRPFNHHTGFIIHDQVAPAYREGSINFSAYREGVLCAYDWRNIKILHSNAEAIFGSDVDGVTRALTNFDTNFETVNS